ncbi:hypothetical protein D3C79_693730 [compost metagenome]
MQQVQINKISAKALEATLTGCRYTAEAGIVRVNLTDHENLLAAPGDRLADHLFSTAFSVHLSGVDQCQAQFDALLQGGHFAAALARVFTHVPRALTDGRNVFVGKLHCTHDTSW